MELDEALSQLGDWGRWQVLYFTMLSTACMFPASWHMFAIVFIGKIFIPKETRRMAIANGTCVSFCNQPKARFGLPWVCPWNNRGKCYMNGKRIQCWSNA